MTPTRMLFVVAAVLGVLASAAVADDGSATSPTDFCLQAIGKDPVLAKELGEASLGVDAAGIRRAQLDKEAGDRRRQQDDEALDARARKIAIDERQVILAYAAMWVIAAGFVVFLWRKQGALKAEIAGLRRELEDAAKAAAKGAP